MDMQQHVNVKLAPLIWPRARRVQFEAEWVKCELDSQRTYDFMRAYAREPHVAFMNVKSDDELADFVKTWGPLAIPDTSPRGTSWMKTEWYRIFQRDLKATAGLLRAFRKSKGEEQALAEFLAVKKDQIPSSGTPSTADIFLAIGVGDDPLALDLARQGDPGAFPLNWNAKTDARSRHRAIARLIEMAFTSTARMHALWQERPSRIEVLWELNNLEDALTWMVFQDAITDRLPQICPECQEVFRPFTRHEKKFCSFECAHRVAARKWRRKDLQQKKSSSRKER